MRPNRHGDNQQFLWKSYIFLEVSWIYLTVSCKLLARLLQEFQVLGRYICFCKILSRSLWCERFFQDSCKKSLGEYLIEHQGLKHQNAVQDGIENVVVAIRLCRDRLDLQQAVSRWRVSALRVRKQDCWLQEHCRWHFNSRTCYKKLVLNFALLSRYS